MDIFAAAANNNLARVSQLLEQDTELIRARDFDQRTALHSSALHNALPVMEFLLSKGADVSAVSICGDCPLHLAETPAAVRLLIDAGADPDQEDHLGVSPRDWAVRERRLDLFWELARALDFFSPIYQLMLACQEARLAVDTHIHGDFHCITVDRLGWRDGKEHCLGWRHGGTIAGWNCYQVSEIEEAFFGDPLAELPEPDRSKRPTGSLDEVYPFSLPRKWLLVQRDPGNLEIFSDLLDGQELDVVCCSGPGRARKLFRAECFDGVIGDKDAMRMLLDIYYDRLKCSESKECRPLLVFTEARGLEEIEGLLQLDASIGPDLWIEGFMNWLD